MMMYVVFVVVILQDIKPLYSLSACNSSFDVSYPEHIPEYLIYGVGVGVSW